MSLTVRVMLGHCALAGWRRHGIRFGRNGRTERLWGGPGKVAQFLPEGALPR
jgi:hypothetical protein